MKTYPIAISILTLCLLSCQPSQNATPIKNVILMIGDGMGPQQVSQAIYHRKLTQNDKPPLALESLYQKASHSVALTHTANSLVTDSAAGATALACGKKSLNDTIAKDEKGFDCKTILEIAKEKGKSTGLISTTRYTHATPAAFAAHNISRTNELDINKDILFKTQPDLILSGGLRYLQSKDKKVSAIPECQNIDPSLDGNGKLEKSILSEVKAQGYQLACNKTQLQNLEDGKILGLFSQSVFPFIQTRSKIKSLPSLSEMTTFALNRLNNNPNGFFIMIESGLIDYAGHANDAGTMLQETLDFDEAIKVAMDFVDKNPDTLLIVTADHETGGFGYSYRRWQKKKPEFKMESGDIYEPRYSNPPINITQLAAEQKVSASDLIEQHLKDGHFTIDAQSYQNKIKDNLGVQIPLRHVEYAMVPENTPDLFDSLEDTGVFHGSHESAHASNRLARSMSAYNFSNFATGNHTATPVDVFVYGSGIRDVPQLIDNTDVFKIMTKALD